MNSRVVDVLDENNMLLFAVSDVGRHDKRSKADKDDKKEKQKGSQVNFEGGVLI